MTSPFGKVAHTHAHTHAHTEDTVWHHSQNSQTEQTGFVRSLSVILGGLDHVDQKSASVVVVFSQLLVALGSGHVAHGGTLVVVTRTFSRFSDTCGSVLAGCPGSWFLLHTLFRVAVMCVCVCVCVCVAHYTLWSRVTMR